MNLIVLAGTHMAACTDLRRQILDARPRLAESGVHVPRFYDENAATWHNLAWELIGDRRFKSSAGTLATATDEARAVGAAHLLLMSEEFETAAIEAAAVDQLAAIATRMGGRIKAVVAFRHQMAYLNLVFAFRAINGNHSLWFEDFVREPQPSHQFDYPNVVERFRHPAIDVVPVALSDTVAGGGLEFLLEAAGAAVPGLEIGPLQPERPPSAMRVLTTVMGRRLAAIRLEQPGHSQPHHITVRETAVDVGSRLDDRLASSGPFWGWTTELAAEMLPRYEAHNADFLARYGVSIPVEPPPTNAIEAHVRNLSPAGVKTLVDELRGIAAIAG